MSQGWQSWLSAAELSALFGPGGCDIIDAVAVYDPDAMDTEVKLNLGGINFCHFGLGTITLLSKFGDVQGAFTCFHTMRAKLARAEADPETGHPVE